MGSAYEILEDFKLLFLKAVSAGWGVDRWKDEAKNLREQYPVKLSEKDEAGFEIFSNMYLYRLCTENAIRSAKMIANDIAA